MNCRVRNALEGVSWAAVLICGAVAFDHFHEARVSAQVAEHIAGASGAAVNVPAGHGDGAVIGRLEIPAVRLTVPVMENYDPASLKRGVGHIPGTAMPGGLGNLGLAGHRDTFFRPLRNIRIGMTIDVVTAEGKFAYRIESTEIVSPDKVDVLDIRDRPELTLVTCYPFNFIGAAPRRFIVHARLLSLDPG